MSQQHELSSEFLSLVPFASPATKEQRSPARNVIVIGMHRSGTSAVAELLGSNGGDLGDPERLLGGNETNPRGHFEQKDVKAFNQRILEDLGGDWWAPPMMDVIDAAADDLVTGARQLWRSISDGYRQRPVVLKDPRLSLLLPIWRQVLPDSLFVVCVRDPLAVARSLLARNQLDLPVGLALWESYTIASLRGLEHSPVLFVDVQALMDSRAERAALVRRVRALTGLAEVDEIEDPVDATLLGPPASPSEHFEHMTARQIALQRSLGELPRDVVLVEQLPQLRVPAATLRLLKRHQRTRLESKRLQSRLADSTKSLTDSNEQVEKLRSRAHSLTADVDRLTRDLEKVRADADAATGSAQAARAEADKRTTDLATEIDLLRRQLAEATTRQQGADEARGAQEQLTEILQRELQSARDAQAAAAEQLRQQTAELATALAAAAEAPQQTVPVELQIEQEASRQRIADLEVRLRERDGDVRELTRELERLRADAERLSTAAATATALRNELDREQQAHAELRAQSGNVTREALNEQARLLEHSQRRVSELTVELQTLRRAPAEAARLQQEIATLQAEVDQLRPIATEVARLQLETATLQAEVDRLRPTATEVARLQQETASLRTEVEASHRVAARAKEETAQTHALYAQAFESRSWRWTRMLRHERRPQDNQDNHRGSRAQPSGESAAEGDHPPTAVVAHVFYPELWPLLRAQLDNLQVPYDLFVTLAIGHSDHLRHEILMDYPHAFVRVLENVGRDIGPLCALLEEGALEGYSAVLKLHSKRSQHRIDGDEWRSSLWHGLLPAPQAAAHFAALVSGHPDVGCVVPAGNVRHEESLGSNEVRMRALMSRIGIDFDPAELAFPAGSMYWLDGAVLELLAAIGLRQSDFEPEEGQIDGTTAHAVERIIGVLLTRRGQEIVSAENALAIEVPDRAGVQRPRVLAFYLPQFHRTVENDAWWGEGFTDWRNVRAAQPWHERQRFPRAPVAPLGEYDLTQPDVLGQQAQLAAQHGVDGFLVYHYWFSGRRLLERPLEQLLERPDVAFPFALVWANENWTRTWDGLADDVLVEQGYEEGWPRELVGSLTPYLCDARYLHVDGRPLVVIFKPGLVPDLVRAVERLRQEAHDAGVGDLHLAGVLHDRHAKVEDVAAWRAFDSWIEFPPLSGPAPVALSERLAGSEYDYRAMVDAPVQATYRRGRRVHPGAMPAWDNTPRRRSGASSFLGSNPADFRRWLVRIRTALAATSAPGEALVCINAWNEWGETAYLEPDDVTGWANLQAVRSAFRANGQTVGVRATPATAASPVQAAV